MSTKNVLKGEWKRLLQFKLKIEKKYHEVMSKLTSCTEDKITRISKINEMSYTNNQGEENHINN